uniref:Smoothelin domain-containing protein n=1 Tax=Glossina austeni TaxID=7395 RepID=A0A1A9V6K6_GLOAU
MSEQRQLDLEREFSSLCPEDAFKTKEISPSELKFHSMALNHPNTTGWNVQSSSEVSPDGRAFRAETVAKTDGMEKIDGGKVEFKGHNEQRSSGSHQGDDKNFVKKSAESSKTHLEEKVVTGDENSRRSEVRMSSTTSSSSSKVVQSSSTTDYDNENFSDNSKYFDDLKRDQARKAQSYQQEIKQNQQSDLKQNHQVVDQRRRETEQHINNREERSVHNSVQAHETREVSKNYVDMDKASPEYQRHVQYLMSQPGEVVSNTVEYIKPNVKMITTVKHLPDGTIVRSKRYETEEINSAGSNHGNIQTAARPDKVEKSTGSTRRPSADVVDNFSTVPRSTDLQSQEAKFSTVKKSHQKFSTESKSQTIHETKERSDVPESSVRHFHPDSLHQPPTDSNTPRTEMPPHSKNTVEYNEPIYQEKQPRNSQDIKQNLKELHVPTEEGEMIIVTSEKRRDVKQQSKSERIVEREVIIDEAHQQNERYRQIANRPSEHPNSPQYTISKAQPNVSPRSHKVREQPEPIIPHSSVHVDDNVSIASSEKSYTNKRNFTSEFEITPSRTPSSAEPVVNDNWKVPVTSQGSRNIPVIERDIPNNASQKYPKMRDTKPIPSTSPVKKPGSTTVEATRNVIQKEKELDAAHRAFAASLRGPSAVDSRRESYSDTQKHTPRSSISSNKTFRRDMREGSNDSTAPSDHSRITTNTVTKPTSSRHTPTKHTVHTTKKDHNLDDTNDVTYSPRNTKSPSPSKSVTSTSSATRMSKTIPRDVPKPDNQSSKPVNSIPLSINVPLTSLSKSAIKSDNFAIHPRLSQSDAIEEPCIKKTYYLLGPSDSLATQQTAEKPSSTTSALNSRVRTNSKTKIPFDNDNPAEFHSQPLSEPPRKTTPNDKTLSKHILSAEPKTPVSDIETLSITSTDFKHDRKVSPQTSEYGVPEFQIMNEDVDSSPQTYTKMRTRKSMTPSDKTSDNYVVGTVESSKSSPNKPRQTSGNMTSSKPINQKPSVENCPKIGTVRNQRNEKSNPQSSPKKVAQITNKKTSPKENLHSSNSKYIRNDKQEKFINQTIIKKPLKKPDSYNAEIGIMSNETPSKTKGLRTPANEKTPQHHLQNGINQKPLSNGNEKMPKEKYPSDQFEQINQQSLSEQTLLVDDYEVTGITHESPEAQDNYYDREGFNREFQDIEKYSDSNLSDREKSPEFLESTKTFRSSNISKNIENSKFINQERFLTDVTHDNNQTMKSKKFDNKSLSYTQPEIDSYRSKEPSPKKDTENIQISSHQMKLTGSTDRNKKQDSSEKSVKTVFKDDKIHEDKFSDMNKPDKTYENLDNEKEPFDLPKTQTRSPIPQEKPKICKVDTEFPVEPSGQTSMEYKFRYDSDNVKRPTTKPTEQATNEQYTDDEDGNNLKDNSTKSSTLKTNLTTTEELPKYKKPDTVSSSVTKMIETFESSARSTKYDNDIKNNDEKVQKQPFVNNLDIEENPSEQFPLEEAADGLLLSKLSEPSISIQQTSNFRKKGVSHRETFEERCRQILGMEDYGNVHGTFKNRSRPSTEPGDNVDDNNLELQINLVDSVNDDDKREKHPKPSVERDFKTNEVNSADYKTGARVPFESDRLNKRKSLDSQVQSTDNSCENTDDSEYGGQKKPVNSETTPENYNYYNKTEQEAEISPKQVSRKSHIITSRKNKIDKLSKTPASSSKTSKSTKNISVMKPVRKSSTEQVTHADVPAKTDDVDNSLPDPDCESYLSRRRSSNISVNTEIIIDHTAPNNSTDGGVKGPQILNRHDSKNTNSCTLKEKIAQRNLITERKDSAPVNRVTRSLKDLKVSRSSSEKIIKITGKPSEKTAATVSSERRPKKCFATKTINLAAEDRLSLSSKDMENVVIDIQHAKSSREASPDKIVPTPVPIEVDVGKPRYPDLVQEPEDEPRNKSIEKNIPIFEEETNAYVRCHVSEVNLQNQTNVTDSHLVDTQHEPDDSPSVVMTDDDECLLTVQEKVSKFSQASEEIRKPKSISKPYNKITNASKVGKTDDKELFVSHDKRNLDSVPITEGSTFETLNINANISDGVLRELSTTVKLAPSTPQKSPELVRHISKHMTTSYQAEEDLEEIERNSKQSVNITKNSVPQKLEKFSVDDSKDKMIPHTATHTNEIEMRRQNDILSRPSVFQARLAPRPNSMPAPTEARKSQIARHVIDDIESDYKRHIDGKPVSKDEELNENLGQAHLTHKTPKSPSPTEQNFPRDVSFKHQQSIETRVSSNSINQSLKKSELPGNQVTDYPNVSSTHPQHSGADMSAKMVLDTAKPVSKYTNGSVTSRRNIFENHITMSKTNKKLDSSAPLFAGKRPSYMDHTKSSLEHTRRDSLEINKSNFLRKLSRDDETHTQNERATAVKFDIPQAVGKAINLTGDVGEETNVEQIFDITILEQMLEETTSYELRRRIRAQIRLVRKDSTNDDNYKTTSHITNFDLSDKEFSDSIIESERSNSPKHKTIRSDLKKEIRQETDSQKVVGKVKSITSETVDSNDVEVSKSLKNPKYSSPHVSSNLGKPYPSQSADSNPDRRNLRKTHEVCTSSQRRSPSPKSPERSLDGKHSREFHLESQKTKESNVSTRSRSQHNKSPEIYADRHSRETMSGNQKMQQENVSSHSGIQRNRYSERKPDSCNSNHINIEAQKLSEKNFTSESRSQSKKQSQHSHDGYDSYDSTSEMKERSISPESRSLTRKLSERNSDYLQAHSCTLECQKIAQTNVCPQLPIQSKRSPKQSPDRSNVRQATADTRKLHDRKVGSQSETQFKKSPERGPFSSKPRKISPSGPQSKRSPERTSDCSKLQYGSPSRSQPIKSRERSPDHNDNKATLWEQTTTNRRNTSPPSRSQHHPKESLPFAPNHSAKEVNVSRTVSPDAKRAVTTREHTISSQQKIQRVSSGSPENVSSTAKSNVRQEYGLKKTAKQKYETDSKIDAKVPIWVNRSNVLKPKASRKSTPANGEAPTIYNKTAKTTFTQKEISTKQEQDSVISSYGIGPTDENGLPLFGIKALKKKPTLKPSDITEEVTGYVIEERSYSDNKTAPIKQRQEFYYSTNPNQLKQLTNQISEKKSTYQDNYMLDRKDDEFSGTANITYVSHSRENEKNDKNLYRETSPNLKKDRSDFYQTSEEDNYKISTMDDDDSDPYQSYHIIDDNESARETDEIQQVFTTTTKSFLNSEEKVMHNVSDVLELMKNADNVVEEGDTASDQEARALLNKFLGASIIMKGAEAATSQIYQKNNTTDDSNRLERQEVKIIRKTKTKTGNSSSSVSRTTCDLEEIWDEYILKELLDQAKTYEERRKIRARLRELMAEREERNSQSDKLSESEVEKKVVVQEEEEQEEEEEEEDETSASESEEVIEESSPDIKEKETSTIDLKSEQRSEQIHDRINLVKLFNDNDDPKVNHKYTVKEVEIKAGTKEPKQNTLDINSADCASSSSMSYAKNKFFAATNCNAAFSKPYLGKDTQKCDDTVLLHTLGVPQKEDSGTESGEDLRLLCNHLQITNNSNIIDDVTSALKRLERYLNDGSDITAVDSEKRRVLLALVSRLQAALKSPEKLAEIAAAMSEIDDANKIVYGETSSPEADSHRSNNKHRLGKRRGRANRHTIDVTREELADARRYMLDMETMESFSPGIEVSTDAQYQCFSAPRKLSYDGAMNEQNSTNYSILSQCKTNSVENAPKPNWVNHNKLYTYPVANTSETSQPISGNYLLNINKNLSERVVKQTSWPPEDSQETNCYENSPVKSVRFSNKKYLMKRANTIDIPKAKKHSNGEYYDSEDDDKSRSIGLKRTIQVDIKKPVGNVVPPFEPKTENDRKFLSFINKHSDRPSLSWNTSRPVSNWSNKFGSLKHTFEVGATPTPTANKPPQAPGHVSNKNHWNKYTSNHEISQAQPTFTETRRRLDQKRLEIQSRERDAVHPVLKPIALINQFKHAPNSGFKHVDSTECKKTSTYKPEPQMTANSNVKTWKSPPPRSENHSTFSPPLSSEFNAPKIVYSNPDFYAKRNMLEERSINDGVSQVQRHNSLRSSNLNKLQIDEKKKRPSLPNTADPFVGQQIPSLQNMQRNVSNFSSMPAMKNISLPYGTLSTNAYASQPCLSAAVENDMSDTLNRVREDSLTNPKAIPLILTLANPLYCPDMAPADVNEISRASKSLQNNELTHSVQTSDSPRTSNHLTEYHAISKVMGKPQCQTAVTIGKRTAYRNDEDMFSKNSASAKNLLTTMKNIAKSNGESKPFKGIVFSPKVEIPQEDDSAYAEVNGVNYEDNRKSSLHHDQHTPKLTSTSGQTLGSFEPQSMVSRVGPSISYRSEEGNQTEKPRLTSDVNCDTSYVVYNNVSAPSTSWFSQSSVIDENKTFRDNGDMLKNVKEKDKQQIINYENSLNTSQTQLKRGTPHYTATSTVNQSKTPYQSVQPVLANHLSHITKSNIPVELQKGQEHKSSHIYDDRIIMTHSEHQPDPRSVYISATAPDTPDIVKSSLPKDDSQVILKKFGPPQRHHYMPNAYQNPYNNNIKSQSTATNTSSSKYVYKKPQEQHNKIEQNVPCSETMAEDFIPRNIVYNNVYNFTLMSKRQDNENIIPNNHLRSIKLRKCDSWNQIPELSNAHCNNTSATFKSISTVESSELKRSKSGHNLAAPKMFEAGINKAEIREKQKTVAAYFSGQKSPTYQVANQAETQAVQMRKSSVNRNKANEKFTANRKSYVASSPTVFPIGCSGGSALSRSATMPHIANLNLLDESNVEDAFEQLIMGS